MLRPPLELESDAGVGFEAELLSLADCVLLGGHQNRLPTVNILFRLHQLADGVDTELDRRIIEAVRCHQKNYLGRFGMVWKFLHLRGEPVDAVPDGVIEGSAPARLNLDID